MRQACFKHKSLTVTDEILRVRDTTAPTKTVRQELSHALEAANNAVRVLYIAFNNIGET